MKNFPEKSDLKKTYLAIITMLLANTVCWLLYGCY